MGLTATNFQSHRKTTLTFRSDARIIAIVGETDSGKSSLMRSLRYLFLLDPAYPSVGETKTGVGACFDDCIVGRATEYSGGKKIEDILNVEIRDGKNEDWSSFNKELPEGFTNQTEIRYLDVEDVESKFSLNFIGQMDRVLPLALKPSQISKIFGAISGRNAVDSAIKETNVQSARIREMLKATEEILFREKEKLGKAEARMPRIERKEIEALFDLLDEYDDILLTTQSIDRLEDTVRVMSKARPDPDLLNSLDSALEEVGKELELLREISGVSNSVREVPDIKYKETVAVDPDDIGNKYEDLSQMLYWNNETGITEDSIAKTNEEHTRTSERAEKAVKELNDFLDKNGVCPYSGEKLPGSCRKKLSQS